MLQYPEEIEKEKFGFQGFFNWWLRTIILGKKIIKWVETDENPFLCRSNDTRGKVLVYDENVAW